MSSPARRLRESAPADAAPDGSDLGALEAISAAAEGGAGLPELVRAAARALDASLMLVDEADSVLAVSARSPADESALSAGGSGVQSVELAFGGEPVGRLQMRLRSGDPQLGVLALVRTVIAAEVDRLRGPARASASAASDFVRALLDRDADRRADLPDRAQQVGLDLDDGASVLVVRAHPHVAAEDDWRARLLANAERGARAVAPASLTALADESGPRSDEVVIVVPGADADETQAKRAADAVLRELQAGMPGFSFTVGRSRYAADAADLAHASDEALLAANVADAGGEPAVLAFEQTGAYRILLPAMSERPEELHRFYAETIEPLVAYDEQYETDLVATLEAFLECNANVAQTAERMFTHRHTIRYRLERVRDLSTHDVGSSDGREKLSLGLKAMRVLGIVTPHGPAHEDGAEGGRVPRGGVA